MKRGVRRNLFAESWLIVRNNRVLFAPDLIVLGINVLFFWLFLLFTGLDKALMENNPEMFFDLAYNWYIWLYFGVYLLATMLIDNFFLTAKYGMIKDVLKKKKTDFKSGISFAKEYYFSALGIHIISSLIVIVPLVLLAVILFLLLPVHTLVALTIFIPLAIAYLIYITIRLLFVYPVMAFEKEGAYKSIKDDFHFVKTHLHHTLITWLIVIGVSIFIAIIQENLSYLNEFMVGQLFFLGLILAAIILALEISVSVWEHVFIFKSYLGGKKR